MATHAALRRALGAALDDLSVHIVNAATANTVQVAAWTDASPGATEARFGGSYLYSPATSPTVGLQVQARMPGFVPVTGTLSFDPPWTPPAPGAEIELSGYFPSRAVSSGETDYRAVVNRGLGLMLIQREVLVAIVPGVRAIPLLGAVGWLDRPERLVGIREPSPAGVGTVDAAWRGPRLVPTVSGGGSVLEMSAPFAPGASGNLSLIARAPAVTWIKPTGGSWAESTQGLVLDLDEADVSVQDFLPFGLLAAYEALMHRSPAVPGGDWQGRFRRQWTLCSRSPFWDPTVLPPVSERQATRPTAATTTTTDEEAA